MRHPKLESVRQRYQRACGYCGVTEAAVGSDLTVVIITGLGQPAAVTMTITWSMPV